MLFGKQILSSAAVAVALLASTQAFAAADPTGVWMNDTGRGAIEIKPCGAGLCGHVVWVKDANDAGGCGRQIIGNAEAVDANTWDNGWIYSPERKKRFDVELTPLDANRLRVKGYAGTKLFSKTMIWTRAPQDLVRCGTQAASAAPAPAAANKPTTIVKAGAVEEIKPSTSVQPIAPATKSAATEPSTAAASAPAPAEQKVAENESEGGFDPSALSDKFGDVLKKGPNGKCKLDLPWVKLDFKCEK